MNVSNHPSPEQLEQFALGVLPDRQLQQIADHIQTCNDCLSIVTETPNDQFLGKLHDLGNVTSEVDPDEDIPKALQQHPRYEVLRELGRGGMGAVFLARHRVMNRLVALKLIRPDLTRDGRIVDRFMKEVRVSGQHSHPNIVTAFDAEHDEQSLFLVMEYVEGINLHQLVKKNGALSIRQACHFALQVAQGLEHACRRGLIHRDIKPKNLIVTKNGRVKILDFGLATLLEIENSKETQELTETGIVLGSPDYISPEQASDAKRADVRSDIYSLGCTLFFMLAGRVPFKVESLAEKIGAHLHLEPPNPKSLRPDIPDALANFVLQMLAKNVANRPQTHAEIIEFLRSFAKQQSTPLPKPMPVDEATVTGNAAEDTLSQSVAESIVSPLPQAPQIPVLQQQNYFTPKPNATITHNRFVKPIILATAAFLLIVSAIIYWWSQGNDSENHSNSAALKSDSKVLIVVPFDNYWPNDFDGVVSVFNRLGIQYQIASNRSGNAIASDQSDSLYTATVNRVLTGEEAEEFDAVIFIGAFPVEDMVFINQTDSFNEARKLIREMLASKKIVAAVCGGVAPIYDASVLGNRRIAFSQYMPERLKDDSSINWVRDINEPVVVDDGIGTLITGQRDSDAMEVATQVISRLQSSKTTD